MKKEIFEKSIRYLLEIEPDESPMISCFIGAHTANRDLYEQIRLQAALARDRLPPMLRSDYDEALAELKNFLDSVDGTKKSVAVFARWGGDPVFLPMKFDVPLETSFIVDSVPLIYPLIELKDTYHRFVIAVTTEREGRILEMTVGSVTEELITQRPDLRKRAGREWTREAFHRYKREKEHVFIREKVKLIDELMSKRGHNHLIIAGSPKMVAHLRDTLPERLAAKLVHTMDRNPGNGVSPIMLESINAFVAAEQVESNDHVELLQANVLRDGLGTAGFDACREALQGGYASMLIIGQDDADEENREELVKLAVAAGIPVETVQGSEALQRLGGAGCLLRYRPGHKPIFAEPAVAGSD